MENYDQRSNQLKVSGKIVTRDGAPAAAVKIIAMDKGTGDDMVLGETVTNDSGNYAIWYSLEILQKYGKKSADIQVKVLDPQDMSKIYGISSVHYNAGSDEKINLVLPMKKIEKIPEYNRIITEIKPFVGDRSLKDMQENKERQDISYLAGKTGWDARLVAMVCLADKYSSESNIPAEFYYALTRAGLPTNADNLYKTNVKTLIQAWEKAVEENIIEPTFKEQIDKITAKFTKYARNYLLEKAESIGVSTFKDLLDISLPDIAKQSEFVELYFNHTGEMKNFWAKAAEKFGRDTAAHLQLDAKLAALTVDNAPLIKKIRSEKLITNNPVDLVRNGLYKPEAWEKLLDKDIKIPNGKQGGTAKENRKNYIDYMVFQLKRSYPTAVLAEMVNRNQLPLKSGDTLKKEIYTFFRDTQGSFEIGKHPVEQFLKDNNMQLENNVLQEVKKLQRVYQISPSDETMKVLWNNHFDSAFSIVQYGAEEFIRKFHQDLGGQYIAKLIYAKAGQVHGTVLNMSMSYLIHRNSPETFVVSGFPYSDAGAVRITDPGGSNAAATLEELFDTMDFCTCEHCRSVLSPAAYLVDLLQFIDLDRTNRDGEKIVSSYEGENPINELLKRRPDIEHIQLTCENTNTVLPYIDLVNEILEYYAVNEAITGFKAPNVEDITGAELLANPQYVNQQAYTLLKGQVYPFNLPFNYFLEAIRLYYNQLGVPLHEAMEKLRVDERLDTGGGTDESPYAWRDIYNEYLGISTEEYNVFTDSEAKCLPEYFGEAESMNFSTFREKYTNAKTFVRRTDISYTDLIEILKTPFINPYSHLIPKLERLGVTFDDIRDFKNGDMSEAALSSRIPDYHNLDQSMYGGNVFDWLRNDDNYDKIMHLILLRDTGAQGAQCDFGSMELRYSLPITTAASTANMLTESDYRRLFRFIRLWKKLGWTIEETGKVAAALYDDTLSPDDGFKDLLIKIALLKKIREILSFKGKDSLIKLLTFWSTIDTMDTHGHSLYKGMFLNSTLLKLEDDEDEYNVFGEDGYGGFLTNEEETIGWHLPALQAAFNVTAEEIFLIMEDAGFNENTPLLLENVSGTYRYALLAKALRISVRELIILKTMSGIDPFAQLVYEDMGTHEYKHPDILKFIEATQLITQSGFKISTLGYFLQHEDITGDASPSMDSILSFAKTLKDGLVRIEQEHNVEDDPTGEITRSKMSLVYENEVVDKFFGFLTGITEYTVFSVEYTHHQEELEESLKINERISYYHSENRLNYRGMMTEDEKVAFEDAEDASEEFRQAIADLYNEGKKFLDDFFDKFPDLREPYIQFTSFTGPVNEKFNVILASFLPALKKKLKHLFVKQTLSAAANIEPAVLDQLLDNPGVIHSIIQVDKPAISDFLELEASQAPGSKFYLEVPDNGGYNFYIETDTDAVLQINGSPITGIIADGIWYNDTPVEMAAGKLHLVEIEIPGAPDNPVIAWQSTGIAKEAIPLRYVYPNETVENFSAVYLRCLKAAGLCGALGLKAQEIRFFGTHPDYRINGEGFLNAIPITAAPGTEEVKALFDVTTTIFRCNWLKESLNIHDHTLVTILANPEVTDESGDSLLLKVTGWDQASLAELLERFHWLQSDLADLGKFLRVNCAYEVLNTFGVPVPGLFTCTTNQPRPGDVRFIQDALRAKYDESAWLEVLQPINDTLRDLRRDALVSHVLHQMQQSDDENLRAIDTPDKLFEYFLIDVEMEPCMKTSRIKQAISSVQLFIQRCLMHLEPTVSPATIKSGQWEWMKHYRVWEANRKIFLYPENWLEPELRDNKSPFFRDLEGELIQADITDELAHTALLNYLEKLDEVARLEICAMYLQENDEGNRYDDIVHVFGRTTGEARKYYYRRYDGNWSPWEKVNLDIEDNPILPVVWNNRLFLFWLNIVIKGADRKPLPEDTNALEMTTNQLNQPVKQSVEVNLSWSEYYNNKWQPRKTSDFEKPLKFGPYSIDDFKRNHIFLSSYIGNSGEMIVKLRYQALDYESEFYVDHYFKLYNKHSTPIRDSEDIEETNFENNRNSKDRTFITYGNTFKVEYLYSTIDSYERFTQEILKEPHFYEIVTPSHPVVNIFEAPFFSQDRKHVFFVEPEERWVTLPDNDHIGSYVPPVGDIVITEVPPVGNTHERPPDPSDIQYPGGGYLGTVLVKIPGIGPDPVNITDAAVNVSKVLFDRRTVNYNNEVIGALGSGHALHLVKSKIGMTGFEKSVEVVQP